MNEHQETAAAEANMENAEQTTEESTPTVEETAQEAPAPAEATEGASQENTEEVDASVWREKAYRLAAEMENLKKRTMRDVEEARKYAVASFARDLLTVQDNMERALQAAEAVAEKEGSSETENLKAIIEGMEMVRSQLKKSFDGAGIERVKTVGEKLDPNVHQAVVEIPNEEHPQGTVVQEIQAGYTLKGRLLRPAMVGTAKSGATNPTGQTEG